VELFIEKILTKITENIVIKKPSKKEGFIRKMKIVIS
tara:strand:+ start:206 stop:316 length:111 start_codon:yes stop_codon:yes gene_type:complete